MTCIKDHVIIKHHVNIINNIKIACHHETIFMQIGDIKMDQRSTTSSLALLDEIKVLAQKSEDRPVVKAALPATEKKKSTIELSFALDEIKNSISSAAFQEEQSILASKEQIEKQKEEAKRSAEQAEAFKIAQEIALNESSQKSLDRERHIEQLRIKYEAERLINPNAIKPQDLVELDEMAAKEIQARQDLERQEAKRIQDALDAMNKKRKTEEEQAKKDKRKLLISASAGVLTLASALAFFILSTPEAPQKIEMNTKVEQKIETSNAEFERIAAIKKASEEKAKALAENERKLQAQLDEEKKQKDLEDKKKKKANGTTGTKPTTAKPKIQLDINGF